MKTALDALIICVCLVVLLTVPTCSNSPDTPDFEPVPTAQPI